jgi:hypothetical protein
MVLKLALAIAAIAILTTLGVRAYYPGRGTPNVQSKEFLVERGSLVEIAQRKKAEGQDKARISGLIIDYGGAGDLDEALRNYSVFVAEPIESKSFPLESSSIQTWYRFRILETLARKDYLPCPTCSPVAQIPKEMRQPNSDEFFVHVIGGVIDVDGIEITQPYTSLYFETGNKYLMFVNLAPSQVAKVAGGPAGAFRLDKNDSLQPLMKESAPLPNKVRTHFGRLAEFKSHINR